MNEHEHIPEHICPECYREKPHHAADCSHAQQPSNHDTSRPDDQDVSGEPSIPALEQLRNTLGVDEEGKINENFISLSASIEAARLKEKGYEPKGADVNEFYPDGFVKMSAEFARYNDTLNELWDEVEEKKLNPDRLEQYRQLFVDVTKTIEVADEIIERMIEHIKKDDPEFDMLKKKQDEVVKKIANITQKLDLE